MDEDRRFIFRTVTLTLAAVILAVVITMLVGLFHESIDNKEIFAMLSPAFQTVIGAFVGFLSALAIHDKPK
jgi:uncharacterized membrane protein